MYTLVIDTLEIGYTILGEYTDLNEAKSMYMKAYKNIKDFEFLYLYENTTQKAILAHISFLKDPYKPQK